MLEFFVVDGGLFGVLVGVGGVSFYHWKSVSFDVLVEEIIEDGVDLSVG